MPEFFGVMNDKFKTPHRAIIAGAVVGVTAILGDSFQFAGQTFTAKLTTMAVFGAIVMCIVSMMSLFKLRKTEPNLPRPFKAVAYPLFPIIILVLAAISLVTMFYYNQQLTLVFVVLMVIGFSYSSMTQTQPDAAIDNK